MAVMAVVFERTCLLLIFIHDSPQRQACRAVEMQHSLTAPKTAAQQQRMGLMFLTYALIINSFIINQNQKGPEYSRCDCLVKTPSAVYFWLCPYIVGEGLCMYNKSVFLCR